MMILGSADTPFAPCARLDDTIGWLPDDNLRIDLPALNRFFEIVAQYELELAQPALAPMPPMTSLPSGLT